MGVGAGLHGYGGSCHGHGAGWFVGTVRTSIYNNLETDSTD